MPEGAFRSVAMTPDHPNWEAAVTREGMLYSQTGDMRPPFWRDYNRILHCNAYRRLKHKTQVFFATQNDHVCTRIEHVNHVAAVSESIATMLGLDASLTRAIAIGHDVGHAPFGHHGEKILSHLACGDGSRPFWHEGNSLHFVDNLETLEDPNGIQRNLLLTYAVRDGIVCHCGEIDEERLRPRDEVVDLRGIDEPGSVSPWTWEGCVVKIADKVTFLGRDIEDARRLGLLSEGNLRELRAILREGLGEPVAELYNTAILHTLVNDIVRQSSPESGLRFEKNHFTFIGRIRRFSYEYIYSHPRLQLFQRYADVVLRSIFDTLMAAGSIEGAREQARSFPLLMGHFSEYLVKYGVADEGVRREKRYENAVVYDLEKPADFCRAVVDFISGMTDSFALRVFDELTRF